MTEVLKAPKPSPAKTDSCNPFHNRTQDRTKERENCTVLDLGISKDREWAAKAPRVGLLNTYCAGKRPRTGWSLINQTVNLEEDTQRCHFAPVPKIAADTSTAISANLADNTIKQRQLRSGCRHPNWRTVL